MKLTIKTYLVSVFLLLLLVDCKKTVFYLESESLENGHWNLDTPIKFTVNERLPSSIDLGILVRNNNEYPFSNLFIIASISTKDSLFLKDTLEYRMADSQGRWLGKGFTNVKENLLLWKENWAPPFSQPPYIISISQANRFNNKLEGVQALDGIVSVGISIKSENEN